MAQNLSSVVENSYFDFEKPFRISFLKRDTVDAVFTFSQVITFKSSQWRFNPILTRGGGQNCPTLLKFIVPAKRHTVAKCRFLIFNII